VPFSRPVIRIKPRHNSWGSGREVVLIRIKVDSQGYICYREFGLKEFEAGQPAGHRQRG